MLIPAKVFSKLAQSWGEKADALQCDCELRLFDPLSAWECFIFAVNPQDIDEFCCILHGFSVEVTTWRFSELEQLFNASGEQPIIDAEFIPRKAETILRMIEGRL